VHIDVKDDALVFTYPELTKMALGLKAKENIDLS
jgi:hypothetical protein